MPPAVPVLAGHRAGAR